MRKTLWIVMMIAIVTVLAACGKGSKDTLNDQDELLDLNVEFEPREEVDVGETILLEATVTHGDELVKDADDVNFEYWEDGNQDDSITVDSTNNGDGTYTAEISLDHDGVFMMYAHVTARDLHTMPKRSVIVGDGTPYEGGDDDHEHDSAEGFHMHFMEPKETLVNEDIELMVHLTMDDESFEKAEVRYEIWNDDVSDKRDWIDAEETKSGEYTATHQFAETGTYMIQIHVEDDDGLHEHEEHEIIVGE